MCCCWRGVKRSLCSCDRTAEAEGEAQDTGLEFGVR